MHGAITKLTRASLVYMKSAELMDLWDSHLWVHWHWSTGMRSCLWPSAFAWHAPDTNKYDTSNAGRHHEIDQSISGLHEISGTNGSMGFTSMDSMTLKSGHAPMFVTNRICRGFSEKHHMLFRWGFVRKKYFCETFFCYHVFVHMLFPSSFSMSPHSIHTSGELQRNQTKTWATTSKDPTICLSQLFS